MIFLFQFSLCKVHVQLRELRETNKIITEALIYSNIIYPDGDSFNYYTTDYTSTSEATTEEPTDGWPN